MRAAFTDTYGPADVLAVRETATPAIGEHDVLVSVRAAAVTAGDRRLRAADFPSFTALVGRLMIGLRRPRHPVQGTMFAGRVVAIGSAVSRYAVGDDVFGSVDHGAYAELLAVPEDGPMARMPEGLSYEEAAAVPYGAHTARYFLEDLGAVKPGERVLVLGASGGVGRFAVQIAKELGAEVTGVASAANLDRVRELGADHVIDYRERDFTREPERYDVVFDVAGASSFCSARSALRPGGRFLTLFVSVGVLLQMALTSLFGRRRAKFSVALGKREDMERLAALLERGAIRPIVAARLPLARITEAHAAVETGQRWGTVVVTMPSPEPESDTTARLARG